MKLSNRPSDQDEGKERQQQQTGRFQKQQSGRSAEDDEANAEDNQDKKRSRRLAEIGRNGHQ